MLCMARCQLYVCYLRYWNAQSMEINADVPIPRECLFSKTRMNKAQPLAPTKLQKSCAEPISQNGIRPQP